MFPKKGEQFNEETIKDLLKDDEIGSKEWYDKIDLISRDVHGPPQSTMYKMFGVDGGGESTEPFEKGAPQRSSTTAVENSDRAPLAPISPNKVQTRQSTRKQKNLERESPSTCM
jgi:hypothetical protein